MKKIWMSLFLLVLPIQAVANLINATSISLEQLEKSKNETLYFEITRLRKLECGTIWSVASSLFSINITVFMHVSQKPLFSLTQLNFASFMHALHNE